MLLTSVLLFPRARAGAVPIHATPTEKVSPKSAVPTLEEPAQGLSGTLVCDKSSIHRDEGETGAAVAVELLLCSSDSCRRTNNCHPHCLTAQEELSRVGRVCTGGVRFPKPFLFRSGIFSKTSKYSTSMRIRIKVSCTRFCLTSLIFWTMTVLLIWGSSLKSLPREKFQF